MQAGTLRHRFTQERPSDVGGIVRYDPVRTLWGSREGLSGIESPTIQASADFRIQIRHLDDITTRDRLVEGTRVFNIVSPPVDPDGRRRALELLVKEQV